MIVANRPALPHPLAAQKLLSPEIQVATPKHRSPLFAASRLSLRHRFLCYQRLPASFRKKGGYTLPRTQIFKNEIKPKKDRL